MNNSFPDFTLNRNQPLDNVQRSRSNIHSNQYMHTSTISKGKGLAHPPQHTRLTNGATIYATTPSKRTDNPLDVSVANTLHCAPTRNRSPTTRHKINPNRRKKASHIAHIQIVYSFLMILCAERRQLTAGACGECCSLRE